MTPPGEETATHAEADGFLPEDILTPIPGEYLDKAPKPKPKKVAELEKGRPWVAAGWQTFQRFRSARSPLVAAGTAYYGFIAMFSLLALAYGVAAIFSADAIAEWLTDTLSDALPGLVGDDGIDPAALERIGRTSSWVGLILLGVSGAAVMGAASDSLHQIFGAPPDGRNPVMRRLYLLKWLALLGPLVVLSYSASTLIAGFGQSILDDLGIDSSPLRTLFVVVATLLTFALDVGIAALLIGRLGGIGPQRRALLSGSVLVALTMGVLKALMASVVSWSIDRPQFGSFAIPVTVLVVLWFQSMALYAGACLTAGVAETAAVFSGDVGDLSEIDEASNPG